MKIFKNIVVLATHKSSPQEPLLEKNQEDRATDAKDGPVK